MAYPNFYSPYPQQPYYQPPMPDQLAQLRQGQYQQIPQDMRDDRIWVSGENAANSYLLVPNAFVRLWDSTDRVFYEKQADSNGKPLPMRVFDYTERTAAPKTPAQGTHEPGAEYVTRSEFDALEAKIDGILAAPATEKKLAKKKEETDDA